MKLLPPSVLGPLSECNQVVQVQGQLTGAAVRIFANGLLVAKATATSANQVFNLLPGKSLHPGDKVTASQKVGSDSSKKSPIPVVVQKKPAQIGPVAFTTPIYACGECLDIGGAVPGATVQVRVQGGGVRGTGVAANGWAGLILSPATGAAEILIARQTACGQSGQDTDAPRPDQTDKALPTPVIKTPLRACQDTVALANVIPGTVVTLERSSGSSPSGTFAASSFDFPVDPPLVKDETITARQEFPTCHYSSPTSPAVKVESNEPVPSPTVIGPLCAGGTLVQLSNLLPGSQVKLLSNGAELGVAEAPSTSFAFSVSPPLQSGKNITAEQELCNKWCAPSNAVQVHASPQSLPTPSVLSPLFACGGAVHVNHVEPGAQVFVWSKKLQAPIGQVLAFGDQVEVLVSPLLLSGDKITAQVVGCGGESKKSSPVTVGAAPERLKRPTINLIKSGTCVVKPVEKGRSVSVKNLVPGAFVDIFVNDAWRGGMFTAASAESVPITGSLAVGDQVQARQRLCSLISKFSAPYTTLPQPPVAHFSPDRTSGDVPLTVTFTDESTGADTWDWDFGDNSPHLHYDSSNHTNPSHTYSGAGANGTPFTVTLTVTNSNCSVSFSETITALPQPPIALFDANPPSGTAPLTVQFIDHSTGGVTEWSWFFGDPPAGQPDVTFTTPTNPTHVYHNGGSFTAELIAHNAGGNSVTTRLVTVQTAPPPPPPPTIVFQNKGSDPHVKQVYGNGFSPNASITINISTYLGTLLQTQFPVAAGTDGVGHFDPVDVYTCGFGETTTIKAQATDGPHTSSQISTTC